MKISTLPSWKSLARSFKLADCELTPGYEGYFNGGAPPRVANYYPNIVRFMSDPSLDTVDRERLYLNANFTDSERILVLSLFWRSDKGSVLREPLLRGIDHELYWHMFSKDLSFRPDENRINGPGRMFSTPLCNPSFGAWRYPWLFEYFATRRYEDDARQWRRAQKSPPEKRYRYASENGFLFARCVPLRRDSGYFEPFEVVWQTYRDNYYRWLPTAPEWHRAYYEWGLIRANRCAHWAVDGMWSDDNLSPVEDYVGRVGQHRRRVSAEEVLAAAQDIMTQHGFLSDASALTLGRPDEWLDGSWAEEAELGATATRFLLQTNADFVDSDSACIDVEVVVADTTKGKTLVVWLPRPHGLYGRMSSTNAFNMHLRMVLLEVDDRLGGDTRCPLNVHKWRGNPVMEEYPVYKYRFSPSPTEQAPHVLKD